jgi:hypothetical protein
MVNYEEAIGKPFTDFKKLIIGIILSIIPIVNFFVIGFAIESSGLSKTKPSKKMPEWKDWGHLFIKGFAAAVIKFIYMVPAIVVIVIGIGLAVGDIASALLGTVITPELMSQMRAGTVARQEIGQIFRENWYLILPTIIKVAPIFLLGLLLALIASFLSPIAVLNYVKNRRFSAAFDFGIVTKKALTRKYLLAWLAVLFLGAILGVILSFIPIVGPAIAFFVVGVIGYSLYGQVYREV